MFYDSLVPKESMYGIFMYIWLIFMVYLGIHTIHGSYGVEDWDLKITSPNLQRSVSFRAIAIHWHFKKL